MPTGVPPELLTASSGSVGDVVYSRNQHGSYLRDRIVPTDPATSEQIVIRDALAECVTAWRTVLTQAQRQSWDRYALAVRTSTALGRSTNASGLGMYVRANVPRIQAAVGPAPRVDQAPWILTTPDMEPIQRVVLNLVDQSLLFFVPRFQQWINQLNGAVLFYASRPQSLAVNFFKGPYRYAGKLPGQPLGPPYTPWSVPLPFPAAAGERVFTRARQTRADARLGPSTRLPADYLPQDSPVPLVATFHFTVPRTVTIQFSELLKDQTHDLANWSVQYASVNFAMRTVVNFPAQSDNLTLFLRPDGAAPPGNIVHFTPPPSDVNGLLTGLPVQTFLGFPVT